MKPTNNKDPRAKLESVPSETRQFYSRCLASRANVEEMRNSLFALVDGLNVTPLNIPNAFEHIGICRGPLIAIGRGSQVADLVAAEAIFAVLWNSVRFKEAQDLLAPILSDLAELEKREEEERHEKSRRFGEAQAALENAKNRALKSAENDPAVIAARKRFEEVAGNSQDPQKEPNDKATDAVAPKSKTLGVLDWLNLSAGVQAKRQQQDDRKLEMPSLERL
jgi:hypothetical protein